MASWLFYPAPYKAFYFPIESRVNDVVSLLERTGCWGGGKGSKGG